MSPGFVPEPSGRDRASKAGRSIVFDLDGTARIEYPSLDCGGWLVPTALDGEGGHFVERISNPSSTCPDGGTVVLTTVQEGALDCEWVHGADRFTGSLRADAEELRDIEDIQLALLERMEAVREAELVDHSRLAREQEEIAKALAAHDNGNFVQAMAGYQAAAERGNSEAVFWIGDMHHFGDGVAVDAAEALSWHRRAAEQGNAAAAYRVGGLLLFGEGTAADPAEAVRWFLRGAESGDGDAQLALAHMHFYGQVVAVDMAEAAFWAWLSSEMGAATLHDEALNLFAAACLQEPTPACGLPAIGTE